MVEPRRQKVMEAPWEERILRAERRHEDRRRRTGRVFRVVERTFFASLILLAVLVLLKFGSHVLPEYFH